MNSKTLYCLALAAILFSCKETPQKTTSTTEVQKETLTFKNKGHQLVYNMIQKVGDYTALREKKDVVYTYTYQASNGKTDISTEKYIFDGEYSYGEYTQHPKAYPKLTGIVEQGFDGKEYWLKHNDKLITNPKMLKRVAFKRPTNFYWFAMIQKLLDPGLNYEHLGTTTIQQKEYDIVKVSFTSPDNKPTDIYQLYINKETNLVDQFLFTVADFGKMETPNLMQLEYIKVDSILLPAKRRYKASTWDAIVTDAPWTLANWTNIQFNNGLTPQDFSK